MSSSHNLQVLVAKRKKGGSLWGWRKILESRFMHGPFFLAVWNGIFSWLQFEIRCRGVSGSHNAEKSICDPLARCIIKLLDVVFPNLCMRPDNKLISVEQIFLGSLLSGVFTFEIREVLLFQYLQGVILAWPQGLPDSPGILGGAWPGIYVQIWDSSFHRSLGMASIIVVTPGSTHLPCLLTERGDGKSQKSLSNRCVGTCKYEHWGRRMGKSRSLSTNCP